MYLYSYIHAYNISLFWKVKRSASSTRHRPSVVTLKFTIRIISVFSLDF